MKVKCQQDLITCRGTINTYS